jgi:hypothetical protein
MGFLSLFHPNLQEARGGSLGLRGWLGPCYRLMIPSDQAELLAQTGEKPPEAFGASVFHSSGQ